MAADDSTMAAPVPYESRGFTGVYEGYGKHGSTFIDRPPRACARAHEGGPVNPASAAMPVMRCHARSASLNRRRRSDHVPTRVVPRHEVAVFAALPKLAVNLATIPPVRGRLLDARQPTAVAGVVARASGDDERGHAVRVARPSVTSNVRTAPPGSEQYTGPVRPPGPLRMAGRDLENEKATDAKTKNTEETHERR